MQKIFNINDLKELEQYLATQDAAQIREQLWVEFLRYAHYTNADDWNKAVRLCECLAIIGWGEHEPLQAIRGMFYNGNPETAFYNKCNEARFVSAIWSKRKNGLTMENNRTSYHHSPDVPDKPTVLSDYPVNECIQDVKLADQRNWIPRTPVFISRTIANCYQSSKAVIESIKNDLQTALNLKMRPEKYGKIIDFIGFNLCFSYGVGYVSDWGTVSNCKANYIIADEKLKLKQKDFYPQLLKMHPKKEIEENGYYLRNRYEYGPFRNGVVRVHIHFEKELSDLDERAQKQKIMFHVEEALRTIIEKLKKKQLTYDFDLMWSDFRQIANEWLEK